VVKVDASISSEGSVRSMNRDNTRVMMPAMRRRSKTVATLFWKNRKNTMPSIRANIISFFLCLLSSNTKRGPTHLSCAFSHGLVFLALLHLCLGCRCPNFVLYSSKGVE